DAIPSLAIPVDFVIVSDSVDPLYEDLKIRFGGRLLRANLRTISNRLDEIKSLWSNPVYELSGTYGGEATTGEVELALSDGTRLRLPVEFEVMAQVEVAQPT